MADPPDDVAVGRGSGAIRIPGRGVASVSRPRGSRGRHGRGRDHPASRGGRFEMSGGVMTVPPPRQPPPPPPRQAHPPPARQPHPLPPSQVLSWIVYDPRSVTTLFSF